MKLLESTSENCWRTQDNELIPYSQMRTSHLFFALRMIWNHTAPVKWQVQGGRYYGPERWSLAVRQRKVKALVAELNRRKPLPIWILNGLKQMKNAQLSKVESQGK